MNDTNQTWQSQYLTEIDIQKIFKNHKKYKINSGTLREVTQIKISIKMTIDLENILVRICPLRKLEMAFQSIKISKFSGEVCPNPPKWLASSALIWFVGDKKHDFIYLKSWTAFLCWHDTVKKKTLDYILYSAFDSPKREIAKNLNI